ncbi:MAG TPA: hypothetical protein TECP_00119 [Hyphomicrobiaceae bacterium MAG_BT-2024]
MTGGAEYYSEIKLRCDGNKLKKLAYVCSKTMFN